MLPQGIDQNLLSGELVAARYFRKTNLVVFKVLPLPTQEHAQKLETAKALHWQEYLPFDLQRKQQITLTVNVAGELRHCDALQGRTFALLSLMLRSSMDIHPLKALVDERVINHLSVTNYVGALCDLCCTLVSFTAFVTGTVSTHCFCHT